MVAESVGRAACFICSALLAFTYLGSATCRAQAPEAPRSDAFAVADYFRLQRVTELALSSDGEWLAYVTTAPSLETNSYQRKVHVRSLMPISAPSEPVSLAGAVSLSWIPRTHELAFLSDRDGTTQVVSFDVGGGRMRQRTHSKYPVENFRFASDGRTFAYLTRKPSSRGTSLYERFRQGETGILVDPATTSSHDFLNPNWNGQVHREPPVLWVCTGDDPARRVPVPGEPSDGDEAYHWASNSRWLSVVYVSSDLPPAQLRDERTSLGVFDPTDGTFWTVAQATAREGKRAGHSYAGGEWLPGTSKLLLRRAEELDPWVSWSQVGLTTVEAFGTLPTAAERWRPLEIYTRGLKFIPRANGAIEIENTVDGVHSLFALATTSPRRSDVVAGLDGSSSLVGVSADWRIAAFVNESLVRPPEIYLWRRDSPARRISHLNDDLARKIHYRSRALQWRSSDGLTISGWLLEPPGKSASGAPWPFVTHVHGGPAFAYTDAFAPYFAYWPYPLEALAERGIAVFVPNYRGTESYGRTIASATGDEPVQDIITGVESLIAQGIADRTRLGLTGHSHGAYVGPLAMGKAKFFRAASFAEGSANSVVMYELMSEQANREIHDPIFGASLYAAPQRYVDDSPDLHLAGIRTASLFEGGAYTAALHMLGYPKATRRAGAPTEFIVYPQTQHNLATPRLQRESAVRNLDWFEFWLLDTEDPDPAKAAQYERWRSQREPKATMAAR